MNPSPIESLLSNSENLIPIVAIICGVLVAIVCIVTGAINKGRRIKAQEETRREVAAYVAEGSMTPDQAEQILKAKMPADDD